MNRRRIVLSWASVSVLGMLCVVLGLLQYKWIDEASVAEKDRLKRSLDTSLARLSKDFNSALTTACIDLLPSAGASPDPGAGLPVDPGAGLPVLYKSWKKNTHYPGIFDRIALAMPRDGRMRLRILNPATGTIDDEPWPASWIDVKTRLEESMAAPGRRDRGRGVSLSLGEASEIEVPLIRPPRGNPPGPGFPVTLGWMLFDVDVPYVRGVVLPELLQEHLASGGELEYEVEVVERGNPQEAVFRSGQHVSNISKNADASISLFGLQYGELFERMAAPFAARGGAAPVPPGGLLAAPPELMRWEMFARHKAGSLEAAVARTRRFNLAVTFAVLALMIFSTIAFMRFLKDAEKLAQAQLNFIAGVSHELRTPLTSIYTAAYNLRGKVVSDPQQVQKYGELIQRESGRLRALVEQVLQFSAAAAGRIVKKSEILTVDEIVEGAIEASESILHEAGCRLEQFTPPELPPVKGDRMALKHAVQNLIKNAAQYGAGEEKWIGVYASTAAGRDRAMVEIRVEDHGPGIPQDEIDQVFEPFFRGGRALRDQTPGTGLGLHLVKKAVEAHHGSVRVESEPFKGTEFILRIPAVTGPAV